MQQLKKQLFADTRKKKLFYDVESVETKIKSSVTEQTTNVHAKLSYGYQLVTFTVKNDKH